MPVPSDMLGPGVIALIAALSLLFYLIPTFAALVTKNRTGTVALVNLLAGWTAIGWVAALIMAVIPEEPAGSQAVAPSADSNRVPCPECREPIQETAKLCPHCHTRFDGAEVSAEHRSSA